MQTCTTARRAIKAIILDAGGVILHPNLDWIVEAAAELGHAVSAPALFSAYYQTIRDVDLGGAPGQGPALTTLEIRIWFLSRLLAHAGLPGELAAPAGQALADRAMARFPRESDIYHWAMPGTRDKLQALLQRGFALGIASNNDGALVAQLQSTGLYDLFTPEALKDSGEEGVAKPDPELLLRAARALGAAPEHCVFVGDIDAVDGRAARAARMAFALIDPLRQPRPQTPLVISGLEELTAHFIPF